MVITYSRRSLNHLGQDKTAKKNIVVVDAHRVRQRGLVMTQSDFQHGQRVLSDDEAAALALFDQFTLVRFDGGPRVLRMAAPC